MYSLERKRHRNKHFWFAVVVGQLHRSVYFRDFLFKYWLRYQQLHSIRMGFRKDYLTLDLTLTNYPTISRAKWGTVLTHAWGFQSPDALPRNPQKRLLCSLWYSWKSWLCFVFRLVCCDWPMCGITRICVSKVTIKKPIITLLRSGPIRARSRTFKPSARELKGGKNRQPNSKFKQDDCEELGKL